MKLLWTKSPDSVVENLIVILIGACTGSLLLGTIYLLHKTIWEPGKKERRFQKSPFLELISINGFERNNNALIGVVDGFSVIVSPDWNARLKTCLTIDVLFNPLINGELYSLEHMKPIWKRNKSANWLTGIPYFWKRNSIGYIVEYSFKPPSYEKTVRLIEELIFVLNKEQFKRISHDESQRLAEKYSLYR